MVRYMFSGSGFAFQRVHRCWFQGTGSGFSDIGSLHVQWIRCWSFGYWFATCSVDQVLLFKEYRFTFSKVRFWSFGYWFATDSVDQVWVFQDHWIMLQNQFQGTKCYKSSFKRVRIVLVWFIFGIACYVSGSGFGFGFICVRLL
jgi:hypothetical protein